MQAPHIWRWLQIWVWWERKKTANSKQDNLNKTKQIPHLKALGSNYSTGYRELKNRERKRKTIPISCHYRNQQRDDCHFTVLKTDALQMLIKTRAPPNRVSTYSNHSTVTKHLLTSKINRFLNIWECLWISAGKNAVLTSNKTIWENVCRPSQVMH